MPINNLKTCVGMDNDVNYKIFSMKRGLPVTLVRTKDRIKEIYPIRNLYSFFEKHPCFWMIPVSTPRHKIIGFIIRGFSNKEYRIIFDYRNLAPVFGWEDFKNYKLDAPILLCEGAKDAIYLKMLYPYTLSLNTSGISTSNLEILKNLTNKVILSYDNDDTGIKSSSSDKELLTQNGIECDILLPKHTSSKYKDCADFLEDNMYEEEYKNSLKFFLKMLGGNSGIS